MTVKLNVLVAFPYFTDSIRGVLENQNVPFRLMIDSGAFTAFKQGIEIKNANYMEFLKTIPKKWKANAIQLDVIGNPKATFANLKESVALGYKVMPVFTVGESRDHLEELYGLGDYVLLGGLFGLQNKPGYFKWVHEVTGNRKVHWLAQVNIPLIKHFKPYSVDSSSVSGGQRFNRVSYYVGGGELKGISGKEFNKRPPQEFWNTTLAVGFTNQEIKKLGQKEAWRGAATPPNEKSLKGLGAFVNYVHHVYRGIEVERVIGTHIYHAVAATQDAQNIFNAYNFLLERRVI